MLSDSFGNVYLGETFSFYLCCTNDSVSESVNEVTVRVELQVGSHRVLFIGEGKADILDAKQSIEDIMKHEVKELGAHVLICTVSYLLQSGERQSFRKFFKFQVYKPLDVKTKFYNAEVCNLKLGSLSAIYKKFNY